MSPADDRRVEHLAKRLARGQRRARSRARWMRLIVWIQLGTAPIALVAAVFHLFTSEGGHWVSALGAWVSLAITTAASVYALRTLRAEFREESLAGLVPADRFLSPLMGDTARAMGVKVRFFVDRDNQIRDGAWAKGDAEGEGVVVLSLPLFTEMFDRGRESLGRAIISHEMGHIAHSDTRLWRLADAYRRALLLWLLPAAVVSALVLLPCHYIALRIPYDATLEEIEAKYQEAKSTLDNRGLMSEIDESYLEFVNRFNRENLDIEFYFGLFLATLVAVYPVLGGVSMAQWLRDTRRKSEGLADLAAVMHGESEGLFEFFERQPRTPSSNEWLLSVVHPSPAWRERKVREWLGDASARPRHPILMAVTVIGFVALALSIVQTLREVENAPAVVFASLIALVCIGFVWKYVRDKDEVG